MKATLNLRLQGHTPAFRDADVELENPATGQKVTRKPFLDGTVLVRDLDPGLWKVRVTHPNLTLPIIEARDIRIFDQIVPTLVPIPIPAELFRDTPIRDIPDADLGPVQQLAQSSLERVGPLAAKQPGEAIRAADWNTLTGVVGDLANAVLQLVALVSPHGHPHPEIAEKIAEVQENLRRFAEAFGRSLVELRREVETGTLRQRIDTVLVKGGASAELRERLRLRLNALEESLQGDTTLFTQKLAFAGSQILTEVNQLAVQQPDGGAQFLADDDVKQLNAMATNYFDAGTQTRPEAELQTYRRSTTSGGAKLGKVFGPQLVR
jgi:hypothetical protein